MPTTLPGPIHTGNTAFDTAWDRLRHYLRSITLRESETIKLRHDAYGGLVPEVQLPPPSAPPPPAARFPFEVYQHSAATPVPATDWRNLRVTAGTIAAPLLLVVKDGAGTYSADDDATEINRDILLMPDKYNGIYLDVSINADGTGGIVGEALSATLRSASGDTFDDCWWDEYPYQPEADAENEAPAHLYIPVWSGLLGPDSGDNAHQITERRQILDWNPCVAAMYWAMDASQADGPRFQYVLTWG